MARIPRLLLAIALIGLLAVPVALGASSPQPQPGQRIDLKVLLISPRADDPTFGAWKAQLEREGVPYDGVVVGTPDAPGEEITDARLADYGANRAKYQAVIVATGNLPRPTDQAALAKLEKTFGIRQISDNVWPTPDRGLNYPSVSGEQGGNVGRLTAVGRLAFPYLKGDVPIDDFSWGYQATPIDPQSFQTLVSGPNDSAYVGIHTRPDGGGEEMVMTVASNQFQTHNQLLRHGMLNWVTRGVYLGYQRNHLELQIDDLFLPDDIWDPESNTTNYDPEDAVRMSAADVTRAAQWSRDTELRLDMVFNGGGSVQQMEEHGSDPLLAAAQANKAAFGWVNHTYEHPNLDCQTQRYITRQVTDNLAWARSRGFTGVAAGELVTGEHSGLANLRPGNPGTIDPPLPEAPVARAGGSLPAGSYDYGVTAHSPGGETVASSVRASDVSGSVDLSWEAICHAASYSIYRSPAGAGQWSRVGTVQQPAAAFTDAGPAEISFSDTGGAGTPAAPPSSNGAVLSPYPQNPGFSPALSAAGVRYLATDSSKPYPQDPSSVTGPTWPAGGTFTVGGAQTFPRYPTNVYYNTATREQQLDEYNWLYVRPSGGGNCVDIPNVTTCRDTPATWEEYVRSERDIMFRHVMGNDPRPHYFHQTNLAQSDSPDGAVFYPVVDALRARYRDLFDDRLAPLVQLTSTQIADALKRAAKWQADLAAGRVSAYVLDGRVHVRTAATMEVPLTGTNVGSAYAGHRSGWTTVSANRDATFEPSDPAIATRPAVSGSTMVGRTLTATSGTWRGGPLTGTAYQWQRCNLLGSGCTSIAAATSAQYVLQPADAWARVRAVVSASNWTSGVSQASSAPSGLVLPRLFG